MKVGKHAVWTNYTNLEVCAVENQMLDESLLGWYYDELVGETGRQ